MKRTWVAAVVGCVVLCGCGTFTGIPSHGGGKRFAIEQELIAASARAAAKGLNVAPLAGRKCALSVVTMGDEGSGNLVGGRFNWDGAIRGDYVSSPGTRTSNEFPVVDTTSITTDGTTVSTTDTENVLDYPSRSKTRSSGIATGLGGGVSARWPSYSAEPFINPNDSRFLTAVLQEALSLQGVLVVPPEQADIDVFVTVDVFGTVRSRTDWHVYNVEKLLAKTALEAAAFDRKRNVVLAPEIASFEAEYCERYVLWMGPVATDKSVRPSSQLLVDFRSLAAPGVTAGTEQLAPLPVPESVSQQKTRTVPPTVPPAAPQASRPEDVGKVGANQDGGGTVCIVGEVASPGSVRFRGEPTVADALTQASGLTARGTEGVVYIVRGGLEAPVVFRGNAQDVLQKQVGDFPLVSGDIIYVSPDALSQPRQVVARVRSLLAGG